MLGKQRKALCVSKWANYKARSLFSPFSMVRYTSADVGLSSRHKRNATIPTTWRVVGMLGLCEL